MFTKTTLKKRESNVNSGIYNNCILKIICVHINLKIAHLKGSETANFDLLHYMILHVKLKDNLK